MLRRYGIRILVVVCVAVVIGSIASSFLNIRLDYCKQIIPYDGGLAAIEEGDVFVSIFSVDAEGKIKHMVKTPFSNYFSSKVRNYRTLFEGESGQLYVMCRVYSSKQTDSWEVYLCNWRLGILEKKLTLRAPEGYEYIERSLPVMQDGKLYLEYQAIKSGELVTIAYSFNGKSEEAVRAQTKEKDTPDQCIYTEYGIVAATGTNGVFLNGKQIYMSEDADYGQLDGLACDGQSVSFIDMTKQKHVLYNLKTKKTSYQDMEYTDFDRIQNMRLGMDGGFTACYEEGENLVGCQWKDGRLSVYHDFSGNLTFVFVLKTVGWIIIVSVVLLSVWNLVGVRKMKNDKDKKLRFISISSRLGIISLLVTILILPVAASSIYGQIKKQYDYWIYSDGLSSAKYISANIYYMTMDIDEEGVPHFQEEGYRSLQNAIQNYQESIAGGKLEYSYAVMTLQDDDVYCIYSDDFLGTMKAEYVVSLKAKKLYKKSIQDKEYRSFEEKRSIGRLEYILASCETFNVTDAEETSVTVGVVADGYRQKLIYIHMLPKVLIIEGILVIVLLTSVNFVMYMMLIGVKRLGKALDIYEKTGDYSHFDTRDKTELGKTAYALKVMAGGLEVHRKDISNSNLSYQRLISKGILKLWGKDSITQAMTGDCRKVSVLCLKFIFDADADSSEQMGEVMDFVEGYEGDILDFNKEKLLAALPVDVAEDVLREDFERRFEGRWQIQMHTASGEIEVGSVGTEDSAYLVAVGELFEECR